MRKQKVILVALVGVFIICAIALACDLKKEFTTRNTVGYYFVNTNI